jgi:hypothetical protein
MCLCISTALRFLLVRACVCACVYEHSAQFPIGVCVCVCELSSQMPNGECVCMSTALKSLLVCVCVSVCEISSQIPDAKCAVCLCVWRSMCEYTYDFPLQCQAPHKE